MLKSEFGAKDALFRRHDCCSYINITAQGVRVEAVKDDEGRDGRNAKDGVSQGWLIERTGSP